MKKHFISGLLPFLILFGLNYGLIKAADLEIILGTSSAFNVVRGASVAGGTSTLYVGSTTVSIGTTTQSAMLTIVGSSTASSDSSLSARNSSGTYTLDVRNDGAVLIGTNTSTLNSALYVGSATSGSLGTITAGFLSMGTISANTGLHGTTTVRFLADIFANGTVTATGFSGNGAGLTGISVSGGLTGGNINTTGTINAGSTTVSTFTTTGSITAGSTGSFKVDTAGSMTATTITSTGSVTASTLAITGDVFKVDSAGSMTAKTITATGSATITGPVLIGTNTPSLASALYVGSSTTNNLGTITAGFLSMGTISANTSLHGTTTVRFLNDIYANGTITAAGNVKASGDIISTKNGMVVKLETAPMGEIYFTTNNGTATTIGTIGVFVKAEGVTTFETASMQFDTGTTTTNNRLRYTGTATKNFHVAMTASYSMGGSKVAGLAIAKNGTTTGMEKSRIRDSFLAGNVQSTAIHVMPVLSQYDYLEVFVTNHTDTTAVTVETLNMFAMGMSSGND